MPSSDPVCGGYSGWVCIRGLVGAGGEHTGTPMHLLLNQNAEMSVFIFKGFLGDYVYTYVYITQPLTEAAT